MGTSIDGTAGWPAPAFPAIPANARADGYVADPTTLDENRDADSGAGEFKPFGDDGLTFVDFLDMINPLQHIPLIGHLYREITGDTIDPGSRIAGSTLFFGPIGTATAALNVFVEYETGKDIGDHAMAMFETDAAPPTVPSPPATAVAVADAGDDPVSAWARGEVAWARQQAALHDAPPTGAEPTTPNQELAAAGIDANQFLMQAEKRRRHEADEHRNTATETADNAAATALWSVPKPAVAATAMKPPPGATAALGGWFSEVNLHARGKYLTAEQLGAAPASRRVDVLN